MRVKIRVRRRSGTNMLMMMMMMMPIRAPIRTWTKRSTSEGAMRRIGLAS